jgi:hypothetical protein
MSTLRVNTLQNTSGVEVYTCKAWVAVNATGTPSIRASGNVSSVTDGGTGIYTVNLITAMSDTNYSVVADISSPATTDNWYGQTGSSNYSTSSFKVCTATNVGGLFDSNGLNVSVFR